MDRNLPTKPLCKVCGRHLPERQASSERTVCSRRCRSLGIRPIDRRIERTIVAHLSARARHHTVCPSEVARLSFDDWQPRMEQVRRAARRLVARGQLEIVQKGQIVDPSTARGPIRLRLKTGVRGPG